MQQLVIADKPAIKTWRSKNKWKPNDAVCYNTEWTTELKLTLNWLPCRLSHAENTHTQWLPRPWVTVTEPWGYYTHGSRLDRLSSGRVRLRADEDSVLYHHWEPVLLIGDRPRLGFDDGDVGGGNGLVVGVRVVSHPLSGHRGGLNRKMIGVWLHHHQDTSYIHTAWTISVHVTSVHLSEIQIQCPPCSHALTLLTMSPRRSSWLSRYFLGATGGGFFFPKVPSPSPSEVDPTDSKNGMVLSPLCRSLTSCWRK